MPIYEFRCGSCGARFEELVPAGTGTARCRECEGGDAVRMPSAQAPPARLAPGGAAGRRREAANAKLRTDARRRFKEARDRARPRRSRPGEGGR